MTQDSGELQVEALVSNGPSQDFAATVLRGDILTEVSCSTEYAYGNHSHARNEAVSWGSFPSRVFVNDLRTPCIVRHIVPDIGLQ